MKVGLVGTCRERLLHGFVRFVEELDLHFDGFVAPWNKNYADKGVAGVYDVGTADPATRTGLDDEKKTTVYHRYYHMFMQGELEKLIEQNFDGRLKVIDQYFDHANWAVICSKVD